jgi:hypothetical protein
MFLWSKIKVYEERNEGGINHPTDILHDKFNRGKEHIFPLFYHPVASFFGTSELKEGGKHKVLDFHPFVFDCLSDVLSLLNIHIRKLKIHLTFWSREYDSIILPCLEFGYTF